MLVVDSFRPVNRFVRVAAVSLGASSGLAAVLVSARADHAFWFSALLLLASLAVGIAVSAVILISYRIAFPDGVPSSADSDVISPGYYGRVARRHFFSFSKGLACSFFPGLVLSAIFQAV